MTPEQWKEEEVLSGMGLDDKKNCVEIDLFVNDQEKADQIASLFGVRSDNRVYFFMLLTWFQLVEFSGSTFMLLHMLESKDQY